MVIITSEHVEKNFRALDGAENKVIFLHGPSFTGKTFVTRHYATKNKMNLTCIDATHVVQSEKGISDAILKIDKAVMMHTVSGSRSLVVIGNITSI